MIGFPEDCSERICRLIHELKSKLRCESRYKYFLLRFRILVASRPVGNLRSWSILL